MNANTVTRFAPSPTGYLHLGHAYSALLNFKRGNRFLLRIEDIDNTRCKPEFETAIYEDLAWLGLEWEKPVRRQSDRLGIYAAQLAAWEKQGLVYRCFKTRKDIGEAMSAPHASHVAFIGARLDASEEEERMATGEPWAWRLCMQNALAITGSNLTYLEETAEGAIKTVPVNPALYGDVVLGRKDIGTSYHLSCVMDDADQGVTLVIRGQDLAEIAGLHTVLFHLLGHTPPVFKHHHLLTDDTGRRLAKRDKAATLKSMREAGMQAADILKRLEKA
ncbi:MAG: tRNA glutamyl-Q(34) synthetase GluQRS [Alphaproteobacteria bacterium]|nr:tRNA glutamyl-Q(34) synthetase GluQRS [Alphaproteobacteria bacterium]